MDREEKDRDFEKRREEIKKRDEEKTEKRRKKREKSRAKGKKAKGKGEKVENGITGGDDEGMDLDEKTIAGLVGKSEKEVEQLGVVIHDDD